MKKRNMYLHLISIVGLLAWILFISKLEDLQKQPPKCVVKITSVEWCWIVPEWFKNPMEIFGKFTNQFPVVISWSTNWASKFKITVDCE